MKKNNENEGNSNYARKRRYLISKANKDPKDGRYFWGWQVPHKPWRQQ